MSDECRPGTPAFVVMLPVFRRGMPLDTPQARDAAAYGWVYSPLVFAELIENLALHERHIALTLTDITEPELAEPFFSTAALGDAPQAGAPAQAKGPQPVSRVVYMSRVDKAFGAVDTNKDGYTDRAEIEAAEARVLANRKAQMLKQREAAFRQLDKDKSGSLSLQEFNSAVAAQSPKPDATPRLKQLDKNGDGKISMVESRAPAEAQFVRLDTNKDGILSVEEQRRRGAKK